ncbi:S24 family peptidase [Longitalea luteola]|uniref:S24 family peptidase n=1 Tax=Longitalea luteola TaxID=2812563 RepID=UPI001A970482|nr:S24 family peptidase [Longitalea luteola]
MGKQQYKSQPEFPEEKAVEIIRVANDAMEPELKCGDVLFIQRQPLSAIVWGRPYVILLKSKEILIRRIFYNSHDHIILEADKKEDKYPREFIAVGQVECILKIKFVERRITEVIEVIFR